jgi:phosphoserine aminotransferase
MARVFNFSSGPAALPEEVLDQAAGEMLDWHGAGVSVMEMSHRSKEFKSICDQAESDLRELLAIPRHYKVLFLQGGASLQFAMVPMNLMRGRAGADYVITGEWSTKAHKVAKQFGAVNVAASAEDGGFMHAPEQSKWSLNPEAAYVHYTSNETIGGVEFHWVPDTGSVPLVADMSSHILSRPVDVERYGLIYAGAQKNMGSAGLTVVIVREDLIGGAGAGTPDMLDYKAHADAGSMFNTPPTYALYVGGLVFQWIKRRGGLAEMERQAIERAGLLYGFLDRSKLFSNRVRRQDRSRMNVPFSLADARLDEPFLAGARERGLVELKGHRTVGGMRASMYNAMPVEGVRRLVEYMREFEAKQG